MLYVPDHDTGVPAEAANDVPAEASVNAVRDMLTVLNPSKFIEPFDSKKFAMFPDAVTCLPVRLIA
jgi:hypothetical protein